MTDTKDLAHALAVLQTRLPRIEKSNTADVITQKGKYSYTYADLADVTRQLMPILGELGLSFTSRPTLVDDGKFVLAYKLLHVSGQREEGQYPLPSSGTPQAMGSAITYARRYCLCAVTGIAPEDDDGAAAEVQAEAQRNTNSRAEWRAPTANTPNGDGRITQPLSQRLHTLFGKIEWTDRDDRLRAASALVGRELASSKDMTQAEAQTVIAALEQAAKSQDPAGRFTEIVAAARPEEGQR